MQLTIEIFLSISSVTLFWMCLRSSNVFFSIGVKTSHIRQLNLLQNVMCLVKKPNKRSTFSLFLHGRLGCDAVKHVWWMYMLNCWTVRSRKRTSRSKLPKGVKYENRYCTINVIVLLYFKPSMILRFSRLPYQWRILKSTHGSRSWLRKWGWINWRLIY